MAFHRGIVSCNPVPDFHPGVVSDNRVSAFHLGVVNCNPVSAIYIGLYGVIDSNQRESIGKRRIQRYSAYMTHVYCLVYHYNVHDVLPSDYMYLSANTFKPVSYR